MALLFCDSFDHYGSGSTGINNMAQGVYAELASSSYHTISNEQSRTGGYSWKIGGAYAGINARLLRKVMGTAHNEVGAAMGLYLTNLPTTNDRIGFGFYNGTTPLITFSPGPSGEVVVRRGVLDGGTIVGTTDEGVLTTSAFNHIEVRFLQDNVVGEAEVRVNGVVELVVLNQDFGVNPPNGFCYVSSGSHPALYFDDLILWDTTGEVNNTFFGPARVNTVFPIMDTDVDDWSVTGAASGAEAIDESTPDGDTTYISAAGVGMVSEFVPGELPPEAEVLAGVYIPMMAKLASAGAGNCQVSLVSDGEVAVGPDYPLTTAYTYWGSMFELDPDGDKQWSKTAFEAARIRVEKTA